MKRLINGIQQVGIGVTDARVAFEWYKRHLGFDAVVFEDVAEACLMKQYTGDKVHPRYAALVMNMQGGGGLELWQYTNRVSAGPDKDLQLGDRGIFAIKIRCRNVSELYAAFNRETEVAVVSPPCRDLLGKEHFFIRDPFGNLLQVIEDAYWFGQGQGLTGGVCGAIVGVGNIEKAVAFYGQLDYTLLHSEPGTRHEDLEHLPGGERNCRRAVLTHSPTFQGPFSPLLGPSHIELIESADYTKKIFEHRWWGDLGYIHLCYDVSCLNAHEVICREGGHPFTVNSDNSFDMGTAAGHFAYNEDPDGTLIEYVETHKVPIIKKLGWYLNLKSNKEPKALPRWMIKCMGLGRKSLQLAPPPFPAVPEDRPRPAVSNPVVLGTAAEQRSGLL